MSDYAGKTTEREDNMFQSIVENISRTMNLPVSIWVPDERCEVLRIAASVGLPARYAREAFLDLSEPSVTGEAFKTERVVRVADVYADVRWKYKDEAKEMGWKSVLCVPIKVNGTVIGVVSVYAFVTRDFSDLEIGLLTSFANQIQLTLEAERRRKANMLLLQVGQQIEKLITEQPKVVLQEIVQGACMVIAADCAVLYPYDPLSEDFYDVESIVTFGLLKPPQFSARPRKRSGLAARVKREIEVVVTNIEREEPALLESPFIQREEVKAFMGIALQIASEVLGILYVDFRISHQFSDEEKDTIRLFAHQAALAIHNSRSYQQAQDKSEALQSLYLTATTLLSSSGTSAGLEATLNQIVHSAQDVLRADLIDLCQYVQSRDEYVLPPIQAGERFEPGVRKTKTSKDDVVCAIVEGGRPQYFVDSQHEPTLNQPFIAASSKSPLPRFVIREKIQSTAAVPLIVGTETVGALFANYRSRQSFPQEQQELIELFASQAAIAILNARLFDQTQRRVVSLEVLNQVNLHIGAELDSSVLFKRILEAAERVLACNHASLFLLDAKSGDLVLEASSSSGIARRRFARGEGLAWQVAETKQPLLVPDALNHPHFVPGQSSDLQERSLVLVPVTSGDRILGVLSADKDGLNSFDEYDQRLLEALANQAAVAIRNARLYQNQQTLNTIGQALTAGLRLQEAQILELLHQQASQLFDTDNMYIALYDDETEIVRFGLAYVGGKRIDVAIEEGWQPRRAGQGRTEEIIRTRKPLFHPTLKDSHDWYQEPGREEYVGGALPSWMGVPMMLGAKVLGVIATYHPDKEYVYTSDDLEFLQVMANQAAVALDNAHMFYGTNQKLDALVQFGREISSSINLQEEQILEQVHQQASQLIDTDNMYIALYDDQTEVVRFGLAYVGGKRIDVATEEDWQPRRDGKGRTEEIIRTRKPLFHPTLQESRDWYQEPGREEYIGNPLASWMGVPMMLRKRLLGVIAAYHPDKEYVYSSDDLEFLQVMANQAAVVLDNARLYQERLDLQEEISSARQLAALGTAMAALQHRINNTFNIIVPNVTRLRRRVDMSDETIVEILDIIERNARYTSDIVRRIQEPLRETERQSVDVNAILNDVVNGIRELWKMDSTAPFVKIELALEDPLPLVLAPTGQVAEVFRNLLNNARRAMIKGGQIIVSSSCERGTIQVRVQDEGYGIPPEIQDRLFARPVPPKDLSGGAGLGLWISRLMLRSLGGDVIMDKTGSDGTTMLVQIPSA